MAKTGNVYVGLGAVETNRSCYQTLGMNIESGFEAMAVYSMVFSIRIEQCHGAWRSAVCVARSRSRSR